MQPSSKSPSVLVVDDDPDALLLAQRLVEKAGINNPLVTAAGGREAKAYLRSCCLAGGGRRGQKPAVMLLDVRMPVVDGFAVLKWVRNRKAFRGLKVVMLSSSHDDRDYRRAKDLHADAYLVKFPQPAVLAATIRACLAKPDANREPRAQS